MTNFLDRIKTDKNLQVILGLSVLVLILLFIFLRPLFLPKKKPEEPCYNKTLIIWLPFEKSEASHYFSDFRKYCVRFEIVEKSLAEIKNDLPLALTQEKIPDIVYVDNEILNLYQKVFVTSTPVFVDTLVAYYNKDILNFLNLKPPKTLEDLKNFAQEIRDYRKDLYVAGLGTNEIKHAGEIILSLMSLNDNYQDKFYLRRNLTLALDLFQKFADHQSKNFVYSKDAGSDWENFAQEKLVLYIGFYQDKKEIFKLNPRLNYTLDIYPLNTFPPKTKIYSRTYYLAIVKKKQTLVAQKLIDWFLNNQLEKFSQKFDLVPFKETFSLPPEKKIVFDSAKNYGETFDFLNKKILFDNLNRIIEETDSRQRQRLIDQIYYEL